MTSPQPRVRVVQVTTRLNVGGLANQVLAVCEGLDADAFEVNLITGQTSRSEGKMLDYLSGGSSFGLHQIAQLGRRPGIDDLLAFVKLVALLRKLRPQIVHTHAAKAGVLGRLASFVAAVPVRVHSYHGHVFRGYFNAVISELIVRFERLLGGVTDQVLVPSESQREEIGTEFRVVPRERVRVVPYGIPTADFQVPFDRSAARAHFGLTRPLVIGALGRMVAVKNQRVLVEAFALLRQSGHDAVELLLVGDGDCRAALQQQVKDLGLTDAVTFHGWQPDLRVVYAAIEVLSIPSLNEGMPIAALESMAAGVPVVASAVGGLKDLIRHGDTGWLVPANDVNALADTLAQVLSDGPLRAGVASRAREHVVSNYDVKSTCDRMASLYRELATAKGQ